MATQWEVVIGLETHAQLSTASKIFSGASTQFGAAPNTQACPVDLALPGVLPVMNRGAVERAIRFGLAIDATVAPRSIFARKNYFYPDLPKGYQISQFDEPLCENGHLDLILGNQVKRVRLQRIHLEEDAGKNTHVGAISHVDLNRAGVPLVEVVTAPELTSAEEAAELMRSLHRLVRWLDVSEADMEKGQLRCDANVSIRRRGEDRLGTRTELKNINSFRFVQNAIEHEIARQVRLVDGGGRVVRETRLWDASIGQSAPMRSKEQVDDYRYFPDPDLPALVVDGALMTGILRGLPELPVARYQHYQREHGISPDDARTLISDRALAEYFEAAVAAHPGPAQAGTSSGRMLANWMLTELLGALNAEGKDISESPMPAATLSALVVLVENGTISGKIGKEIFEESFRTGEPPLAIVERRGVQQISDEAVLGPIVERVVAANPKQAEGFRGGKDSLFGFFVGQVMKETQGRANPILTSELLHKRLGR